MISVPLKAMNRENQPLVTDEPTEFQEVTDLSSKLHENNTTYDSQCHMVFNVTMVTFRMTLLTNE